MTQKPQLSDGADARAGAPQEENVLLCQTCGKPNFYTCGCYDRCVCGHDRRSHLDTGACSMDECRCTPHFRLVAPSSDAPPSEETVIDQCVSHWFAQGGEARSLERVHIEAVLKHSVECFYGDGAAPFPRETPQEPRIYALLKRLEYSAGGPIARRCPLCNGDEPPDWRESIIGEGHRQDCELALMLVVLASARLPAPHGWQPIATAPKDRQILVCRTEDDISVGWWQKAEDGSTGDEWVPAFEAGFYSQGGFFPSGSPTDQPLFWQELPAVPSHGCPPEKETP